MEKYLDDHNFNLCNSDSIGQYLNMIKSADKYKSNSTKTETNNQKTNGRLDRILPGLNRETYKHK